MAKARLYSLIDGAAPKRELRGQAAQVFEDLVAHPEPRLAVDIDASILATKPYVTRQDTLRVTLYYLLVFKSRGLVKATEPVIEATATVEATAADQPAAEETPEVDADANDADADAEGEDEAEEPVAETEEKFSGRRGRRNRQVA